MHPCQTNTAHFLELLEIANPKGQLNHAIMDAKHLLRYGEWLVSLEHMIDNIFETYPEPLVLPLPALCLALQTLETYAPQNNRIAFLQTFIHAQTKL